MSARCTWNVTETTGDDMLQDDLDPEGEALIPTGRGAERTSSTSAKRLLALLLVPPALWLSMVFPGKYIEWRSSLRPAAGGATPRGIDSEYHSFCDTLRYTVCFSVVALGTAFMVGVLCHSKQGNRPVRLLAGYAAAFLVCSASANTIGFAREWTARGFTHDLHRLGLNAEWLTAFWKGQRTSAIPYVLADVASVLAWGALWLMAGHLADAVQQLCGECSGHGHAAGAAQLARHTARPQLVRDGSVAACAGLESNCASARAARHVIARQKPGPGGSRAGCHKQQQLCCALRARGQSSSYPAPSRRCGWSHCARCSSRRVCSAAPC
eukprot:2190821-Prymnesium_polylepis.1